MRLLMRSAGYPTLPNRTVMQPSEGWCRAQPRCDGFVPWLRRIAPFQAAPRAAPPRAKLGRMRVCDLYAGLLIRWSLVRIQYGPPNSSSTCTHTNAYQRIFMCVVLGLQHSILLKLRTHPGHSSRGKKGGKPCPPDPVSKEFGWGCEALAAVGVVGLLVGCITRPSKTKSHRRSLSLGASFESEWLRHMAVRCRLGTVPVQIEMRARYRSAGMMAAGGR